jgi:hypothetical protein
MSLMPYLSPDIVKHFILRLHESVFFPLEHTPNVMPVQKEGKFVAQL